MDRARRSRASIPPAARNSHALLEPEAGVLFARRAVQALIRTLTSSGVRWQFRHVDPAGEIARSRSDALIFACGPWLPKLFPDVLGDAILPTRQEVFFFGAPAGDRKFDAAALPAWISFEGGIYGLPDLEERGVKIAIDAHGPPADPDTMDRVAEPAAIARVREALAARYRRWQMRRSSRAASASTRTRPMDICCWTACRVTSASGSRAAVPVMASSTVQRSGATWRK